MVPPWIAAQPPVTRNDGRGKPTAHHPSSRGAQRRGDPRPRACPTVPPWIAARPSVARNDERGKPTVHILRHREERSDAAIHHAAPSKQSHPGLPRDLRSLAMTSEESQPPTTPSSRGAKRRGDPWRRACPTVPPWIAARPMVARNDGQGNPTRAKALEMTAAPTVWASATKHDIPIPLGLSLSRPPLFSSSAKMKKQYSPTTRVGRTEIRWHS